ncbi:hypothetical protein V6N11_021223 [Hibiscus sabdariffa]|uniref:Uncharacterized protein n=1 Tax=Hibiscus sabdariffa TaxID=183260 RepID=A0ABR2NLT6_9ROSI
MPAGPKLPLTAPLRTPLGGTDHSSDTLTCFTAFDRHHILGFKQKSDIVIEPCGEPTTPGEKAIFQIGFSLVSGHRSNQQIKNYVPSNGLTQFTSHILHHLHQMVQVVIPWLLIPKFHQKAHQILLRPCRNLSPLSGLASNGVEKVVGSNSAVKLDPKAHASGDANRQYKSWAEQINEKVSVGYSDARDTIEEENSKDEPVRRSWGIARNLAEIDSLVCDYLSVRFQFAEGLVDSLVVRWEDVGNRRLLPIDNGLLCTVLRWCTEYVSRLELLVPLKAPLLQLFEIKHLFTRIEERLFN